MNTANSGDPDILEKAALSVIEIEKNAVSELTQRIDPAFVSACQLCLACQGRIIVSGMGKSGHIARKIAATLASTGTPAFFVHPAEASHGDMGMITKRDVMLMISYSGNTDELVTLLPLVKRLGIPLIAMTGNPGSTLAKAAKSHLSVSVKQEACPLGLAPTASTTVTLVMGDALAVALLKARGFTEDDFALSHPGGALGRRLLLRVQDIMTTGSDIPSVKSGTLLTDALVEMTQKKLGMTVILNQSENVIGIFTDGDIRRTLVDTTNIQKVAIDDVMGKHFKQIAPTLLAAEALKLMQDHKITSLIVMEDNKLVGILHMHQLLQAGVV